MSRNQTRVLSDAMIEDIKFKMNYDLRYDAYSVYTLVNNMMDAYLTDDWGSFKQMITETIEDYEDDILLTLNMQLKEDSNDNI